MEYLQEEICVLNGLLGKKPPVLMTINTGDSPPRVSGWAAKHLTIFASNIIEIRIRKMDPPYKYRKNRQVDKVITLAA